jgi:hypothetical protein
MDRYHIFQLHMLCFHFPAPDLPFNFPVMSIWAICALISDLLLVGVPTLS